MVPYTGLALKGCDGQCLTNLEHVAENTQHTVEALIILRSIAGFRLPGDTCHHLSNNDKVDDQRRSQEGVLADIEETDSLMTAHEDLRIVLIQSAFVVPDCRHILDDNGVVRMLAWLVEHIVCRNHVIHYIGLGDLLGSKLLLGAQIHPIVVTEVIVTGNGGELDPGIDHEIYKGRFHLCLTRLEVISADESMMLLGKLNGTWNKGILRRPIDERGVFQDTRNSEDGRRRHLLVTRLYGFHQVLRSVVNAFNDIGKALGVGSPLNNDFVECVSFLEVTVQRLGWGEKWHARHSPDVLADLLHMGHASLGAFEDIVGAITLVRSDEIRVVRARERLHIGHLLLDHVFQGRFQHTCPIHGLGKVHAADVPTTNNKIVRVHHGKHIVKGNVDLLPGLGFGPKLHRRAHNNGAIVVGGLWTLACLPDQAATIGDNAGRDRGSIIPTPSDEHHTNLTHLTLNLEVVYRLFRLSDVFSIRALRDGSGMVGVLSLYLPVGVHDIGRVYGEKVRLDSVSRVVIRAMADAIGL